MPQKDDTLHIRLDKDLKKRLEDIATQRGFEKLAPVIRDALERYVETEEKTGSRINASAFE